MTRLSDVINRNIDKYAGAMALAKGVDVSDELKPCPFCGIVPQIDGDPNSEDYVHGHNLGFVECRNNNCPIAGAYFSASTQKEATAMWNTRPIEDALRAQLAARDAVIERLMEAGNDMTADCQASWYALHIPVCTPVVNWHALVDKYSVSKDGGEK